MRVELDLRHRHEAVHGQADRRADDAGLGQRRVHHPVAAEPLEEALGDAEDAAVESDVLAEQDHPLVGLHLLDEGEVDGLHEGQVGHGWVP
jgi:hypothetical protein